MVGMRGVASMHETLLHAAHRIAHCYIIEEFRGGVKQKSNTFHVRKRPVGAHAWQQKKRGDGASFRTCSLAAQKSLRSQRSGLAIAPPRHRATFAARRINPVRAANTFHMKHRIQWKPLLLCVAVPLAVGGIAAILSNDGMRAYAALRQPPLAPPGWIFPVVWTILYVLMGIVCYRLLPRTSRGALLPLSRLFEAHAHTDVLSAALGRRRIMLMVYVVQLLVNFLWPVLFFAAGARLLAFIDLLVLWVLVLWLLLRCHGRDRTSFRLLVPYLAWLSFAAYLNLSMLLLNL